MTELKQVHKHLSKHQYKNPGSGLNHLPQLSILNNEQDRMKTMHNYGPHAYH